MQIGGTLASVGQRMIDSVSKGMIRQAFETLDKTLEERMAAKTEGREAVKVAPPTETEFASAVTKDVAKSIFQIAEVRMLLYVIPVVIIIIAIAYFLSR